MIIRISKRIQTPKKTRAPVNPSWMQVYILTTPKLVDQPIWNLDLKYFTNDDAILHTHEIDAF